MKKIILSLVLSVVAIAGAFSVPAQVSADNMTSEQLVKLFVDMGIISEDQVPNINLTVSTTTIGFATTTATISSLNNDINVENNDTSPDRATGKFVFNVNAISRDVSVPKDVGRQTINIWKGGELVGKATAVVLTVHDISLEDDNAYLIKKNSSAKFTLTYIMDPIAGPGIYRAQFLYLPLVDDSITVDEQNESAFSNYVSLDGTYVPPVVVPKLTSINIVGLLSEYLTGPGDTKNIKYSVKGRTSLGTDANPDTGFHTQSYLKDTKDQVVEGVNGVFNASTTSWEVTLKLPKPSTNKYTVETYLYCAKDSGVCLPGQLTESKGLRVIDAAVILGDNVRKLYEKYLGRSGSDAEINAWVSSGLTLSQIEDKIRNSMEGRKYFIKNLYITLLKRTPSQSEIDYWYKTGKTEQQLIEAFKSSAEYIKLHSTATSTATTTVPTIKITNPSSGGVKWVIGRTYNIAWNVTNGTLAQATVHLKGKIDGVSVDKYLGDTQSGAQISYTVSSSITPPGDYNLFVCGVYCEGISSSGVPVTVVDADTPTTTTTSCKFDAAKYVSYYPDLKTVLGTDPAKLKSHWLNFGIKEGRTPCGEVMPSCKFVASTYVSLHPDLVKAGVDGLTHYKNYGVNEGRAICIEKVSDQGSSFSRWLFATVLSAFK